MCARFLEELCLNMTFRWGRSGGEIPCVLNDGTRQWTSYVVLGILGLSMGLWKTGE
jgi:hypothetical protein